MTRFYTLQERLAQSQKNREQLRAYFRGEAKEPPAIKDIFMAWGVGNGPQPFWVS